MNNISETVRQINALFHPESVAIVGVPRGMKTGRLFLMALQDQKFPGQIYPINPNIEEIDGLKVYPDITSIPGKVDLAIVLVPSRHALSVVEACAQKGVKGAVLFTSGYGELGEEGLTASLDIDIYIEAARRTAMDTGVDAVVVIGIGLDDESNEKYANGILEVQKTSRKPFIMVGIPGFGEDFISRFCNAGVPFFDSAERAMQTYAQVCRYQDWQRRIEAYTESDADHLSVEQ